ncbi:GAF domain-containing protein [Sphingomonas sp.]|uniref:GAF domain-containing protein n=1 Tax=Sphingomonas sp. TaxID=28214 RepID=UPI001EB43FE4|nr:GAF domain-containing protein [Sphingomonas sp.]MBX3592996.1 GAF domain-containing protein [Sphingomonas sp.]
MPRRGFLNRRVRLTHAAGLLSAAADVADAVAILRDHARVIAAADGITIVRREGDEVSYVAEDAMTPLWTGQRFPLTKCVSGLALLAGEPILIGDIRNDPRVPLNAYLSTFVLSVAMFPIGRTAAVGAYWKDAGPIDPEAVELMAELAEAAKQIFDPDAPPILRAG